MKKVAEMREIRGQDADMAWKRSTVRPRYAPPFSLQLNPDNTYEIPSDFEIVPFIDMSGPMPRAGRYLINFNENQRENNVKRKKAK